MEALLPEGSTDRGGANVVLRLEEPFEELWFDDIDGLIEPERFEQILSWSVSLTQAEVGQMLRRVRSGGLIGMNGLRKIKERGVPRKVLLWCSSLRPCNSRARCGRARDRGAGREIDFAAGRWGCSSRRCRYAIGPNLRRWDGRRRPWWTRSGISRVI